LRAWDLRRAEAHKRRVRRRARGLSSFFAYPLRPSSPPHNGARVGAVCPRRGAPFSFARRGPEVSFFLRESQFFPSKALDHKTVFVIVPRLSQPLLGGGGVPYTGERRLGHVWGAGSVQVGEPVPTGRPSREGGSGSCASCAFGTSGEPCWPRSRRSGG